MSWDRITLFLLALTGCVTLMLTQVGEVLSRLPRIIRAWREVREELRGGGRGAGGETDGGGGAEE
ncbi:hypothetical protein J3A78_002135 [Streptomyces sp. PvR006]|uniref:hypothetical protein n=1 Tax=Streptomyces sp. NPDC056269 TaxID=3345768 RepID=UPI0035E151AE|nr:hypothetical protein [Streptomyces sp. PvR006]